MKLKVVTYFVTFALSLSSCVHVSPNGMTAFGTDAEDITYNTGGAPNGNIPSVAFHASKMNNSNSFSKVTELGGSIVTWWGIGQIAKAAGKAVNTYNQEQTTQQAAKISGATKALEIKSAETIALGEQALKVPVLP